MKLNHQYNYNYKLDELYSREKSYDLHKKKLEEIRAKKSHSLSHHIQQLEKRNCIREQRRRFDILEMNYKINKSNFQLDQKLTEIKRRPLNQEYFKFEEEGLYYPHNLNLTYRRNQAQQIESENLKLACRLMKQEPVLKIGEFKQQYKDYKKLMHRLLKHQQCQNYVTQLSKRKQHVTTLPKTSRVENQPNHSLCSIRKKNAVNNKMNKSMDQSTQREYQYDVVINNNDNKKQQLDQEIENGTHEIELNLVNNNDTQQIENEEVQVTKQELLESFQEQTIEQGVQNSIEQNIIEQDTINKQEQQQLVQKEQEQQEQQEQILE